MIDIKITGLDKVQKALTDFPRKAKFDMQCPSCSEKLGQFSLETLERSKTVHCSSCKKNIKINVTKET